MAHDQTTRSTPGTARESASPGAGRDTDHVPIDADTPLPTGRLGLTRAEAAERFPYDRLLAYHRDELDSPEERAAVQQELQSSPRWRAHLESLSHLDLELAAAAQDAADLRAFDPEKTDTICVYSAVSEGELFARALRAPNRVKEYTTREWARHTAGCVYCRRVRRQVAARMQAERAGLPQGEPLARDWFVNRRLGDLLQQRTEEIVKSARRKALPRLVKRLSADQEWLLVEHVVRKAPLERIAAARGTDVEGLQEEVAQAVSRLPRLFHESIHEAIRELFLPEPPRAEP